MSESESLASAFEQAVAVRTETLQLVPEGQWPDEGWKRFVAHGVTRWTIPETSGGAGFAAADILAGCMELARADLVPAFILTQFQSAITRLGVAPSEGLKEWWLPRLASGECFATVGISHLTTSRQHVAKPVVAAEPTELGYRLTGEVPWVTGGSHADLLVTGAIVPDGRQILVALPTNRAGVTVGAFENLLALTGSQTGPVHLEGAQVSREEVLAGPAEKVMQIGSTGGTGSLTTSALALGHAQNSIDRLKTEATARPYLEEIVGAFETDASALRQALLETAEGRPGPDDNPESLRARTTALALATSQAYLTACKGAGFVTGHPAERLARQAMFFLVWSCPQAVSSKLLREFSGCEEAL
jgi:alkylation response protein AidB-like acyl-CoA dehydrogenase